MSGVEIARAEAEARAQDIRTTTGHLLRTLADAWYQQDHVTLGYGSWAEYCRAEFDGRIALPRSRGDRRELVRALSEAGLSQRAVAAATGMSRNTVARYVAPEVAQIEPPVVEHQDLTAAEARVRTDRLREEERKIQAEFTTLEQAPEILWVLTDRWVMRAIQMEALTPLEAVMAWDRVQHGPRADDVDGASLELLMTGLMTRTGRWVQGFNPDRPLSDVLSEAAPEGGAA